MPPRTRILDRTLCATTGWDGRDTAEQAASIAVLLAGLEVDAIECPALDSLSGEPGRLAAVLGAVPDLPVLAWCGTDPEAVAAASAHGVSWIGLAFSGDWGGRLESALRQAREAGLPTRLDLRASLDLRAGEACAALDKLVSRAEINRICLVGDVATGEPDGMRTAVTDWRARYPGTEIEVRASDAYSLATANALAAAEAGVDWVAAAVSGQGTADLPSVLSNLHRRGERSAPSERLVTELRRRVRAYCRAMPGTAADWVVDPQVISATELRHHRHGPGERYVLVDNRFVEGAGQYCIARRIPPMADYGAGHVDTHVHDCDSLFVFLGDEDGYRGLHVEVTLGNRVFAAESPTSVFVPAGVSHGYRVLAGAGTYLNHVLAGDYNSSLLDPLSEHR
jgi:2-isopropylmalate synthase